MTLKILDCSNMIYVGDINGSMITRGVTEINGEWVPNEARIGAINFILRKIASLMDNDSIVVPVFDRTPTHKRKAYYDFYGDPYGYKAGRSSTNKYGTSRVQIDCIKMYVEKILRECGFPVQACDGYEADDVIYTLWKDNLEYYDKIEIYSGDSDLYFMVTPTCEIHSLRKDGKVITYENYPTVVNSKKYTHYNTIHFHKLYHGDSSDNIQGIGTSWAELIDSCITNPEDFKKLGDLDFARSIFEKLVEKYPNEKNAKNLVKVFNLLVPYYIIEPTGTELTNDSISDSFFNYYLKGFIESPKYVDEENGLLEYIKEFNS